MFNIMAHSEYDSLWPNNVVQILKSMILYTLTAIKNIYIIAHQTL